jgi:hypothetical protein
MGKDERKLVEMARRQKKPVPMRIQNAPDLAPGLELYYDAFGRLTTSRQLGSGAIGPIPYAAISTYCKDEGIHGDLRADVFYHVEHLDRAYMMWQTDRAAYEAKVEESRRKEGGS